MVSFFDLITTITTLSLLSVTIEEKKTCQRRGCVWGFLLCVLEVIRGNELTMEFEKVEVQGYK